MWSSAPKPDVAVTVNEKSPLQTSALRDERNPFSQQWSQNVKLLGDYCRNALTGDVIAGSDGRTTSQSAGSPRDRG